jgi:2-polyprenyl-3-methyl-5-hydroxy-6-metoxy-1,4-benzoquinol methylase
VSIGYWLKYFGLAAAILLMRRSYISKPVLAVATRLGFAKKALRPEEQDGKWNLSTRRHQALLRFLEESGVAKDARILDVGCGPGGLVRRLQSAGYDRVAGCDWHELAPNFEFRRVDLNGEGLRVYPDESFDVVIACNVFEHLENPAFMFRELRRTVGPAGHVFVTVPNCWNLYERVQFFLSGNSTRYHRPALAPPWSHISMFTPNIMETITDRASLELVELRGTYAYFWGHFWGQTTDPLFSYNLLYHFRPRARRHQPDKPGVLAESLATAPPA